ncbi:MAG TPA: dihydrodipicolinate synthase family protein [Burkholderiaceae bacterium]
MNPQRRFGSARQELIERLFPRGIPRLWCPLLTHFDDAGAIDRDRTRAHLGFLRSSVDGLLIPGSTGEGWEMDAAETRAQLECVLGAIAGTGMRLLIGVLKTELEAMRRTIADTAAWLKRRSATDDALDGMTRAGVCGFTVCPPSGAGLTQDQLRGALESVLALGLPTALYQLPQVTGNEMSAATVAALADRFPNFYLLKDTSGRDAVAASGLRSVFLVRGAEGEYASHLADGGGAYDGFLLSTANGFGPELARMIAHLECGEGEAARALSARLSALVEEVFAQAAGVPAGNAFTNANKAIDHFFAHGPGAARLPAPRLHSGVRLPDELIAAAHGALIRHRMMPPRGYLEPAA